MIPDEIEVVSGIDIYNYLNDISSRKLIIDLRNDDLYQCSKIRNAISLPITKLWNRYQLDLNQQIHNLNQESNPTFTSSSSEKNSENVELNVNRVDESRVLNLNLSLKEKEDFWKYIARNAHTLLNSKSADQWDYRGTVYNEAIVYSSSEDELYLFYTLFRNVSHESKSFNGETISNLNSNHGDDEYVDINENSLSVTEITTKYKVFTNSLDFVYMKKNNLVKRITTTNFDELAMLFPFFITYPNQHAAQGELPSAINEFVLLGSVNHAESRNYISFLEIECILNMASEIRNKHVGKKFSKGDKQWEIEYKKLGIDDSILYDVLPMIEDAVQFIDESVRNRKRILVHCQLGISRSATVVIAWVMKHRNWDFKRSFEFVRRCRPQVHPNPTFRQILIEEFEPKIQINNSNDIKDEFKMDEVE